MPIKLTGAAAALLRPACCIATRLVLGQTLRTNYIGTKKNSVVDQAEGLFPRLAGTKKPCRREATLRRAALEELAPLLAGLAVRRILVRLYDLFCDEVTSSHESSKPLAQREDSPLCHAVPART